jgi:SAM-dependent methyltransferase
MDREFNRNRYKDTIESENTSNMKARCRRIASMLPRSGRLLDIGCWDGSVACEYTRNFIRESGAELYGADIVVHAAAVPVYRKIYETDISHERLPVEDSFFDCVVASELIEHVFDTDFVIEEIRRVLKPGGTLILTAPNLASLVNRIFLLLGFQPVCTEVSSRRSTYGNPWRREGRPAGHIRDFTMRALADLVRAHGFRTQKAAPSLGGNTILQCRKS